MTKDQAATYLDISPKTLQRRMSSGAIPYYRTGRSVRLRRSEIDQYIESSRTGPEPAAAPRVEPPPPTSQPEEATAVQVALGEQAETAGIHAIFKTRVEDAAYVVEIDRALKELESRDLVQMMGNSLRSWLGGQPDLHLCLPMWAALRSDVMFHLLLLDPHSEAARERARVEATTSHEEDRDRYYDSHLYIDIMAVARQLHEPSQQWMPDRALRARLSNRDQVSVRFSKTAPTKHLICTPRLCFEESYHIGGDSEIERVLQARGIPSQHCFGGFVPVFAYKRTELTGRLLASHFEHSWEAAEGRTLDKILEEADAVDKRLGR